MTLGWLLVAVLVELGLYVGALARGETVDWYVCMSHHCPSISKNEGRWVAQWLQLDR